MPSNRLTTYIIIGLILGLASGYICYTWFPESSPGFAEAASLLPTMFLRLIKMIIAPLVFVTLVSGLAGMESGRDVGRIGTRTLGWFICASLVSLALGLVLANALQPGAGLHLVASAGEAGTGLNTSALNVKDVVTHAFPTSLLDAMARNEILQIVVFSLFFGSAMAALGERSKPVVEVIDSVAHIMLKVTGYVMLFAPFAVFGALASTVAKEGLDILRVYGIFMGEFYLGLMLLWLVLIGLGVLIVGPRILKLIRGLLGPNPGWTVTGIEPLVTPTTCLIHLAALPSPTVDAGSPEPAHA